MYAVYVMNICHSRLWAWRFSPIQPRIKKKKKRKEKKIYIHLQNILIVRSQNILLNRSGHSLQSLVRFTLGIVVLHILQRSERRLDG